jgi:HK97 family phage prohead protease
MKREIRIFKGSELRAKKDGAGIEGHAAVFNQLSQDLGGFRERVMPGAFADDLAGKPDVRALFNHDPNIILGRTTSGTLRLSEDKDGLHFDCDMPDTQQSRDIQTSIARGDISQCSFGFRVNSQKWSEEPDPEDSTGKATMIVRELHKVSTFDVSPVTYPAYTGTDVDMRTLFPDGVPGEIRSHVPKLDRRKEARQVEDIADNECDCDCANCLAGDCADCTAGSDCPSEDCIHAGEDNNRAVRMEKRAAEKAAKAEAAKVVDGEAFEKMKMRLRLAQHSD